MRDRGMERKIRSVKVSCTMQYRGCQWEGVLRSLEEHLAKDCSYVEVACEFQAIGCEMKLLRKDVTSHMEAGSHNHLLLMSTLCLRQREEFEQRLEQLQGQFHQREIELKEKHTEELQQLRESITVEIDQKLVKLQEEFEQKHQELGVDVQHNKERVETAVQQDRGSAINVHQGQLEPTGKDEKVTDYVPSLPYSMHWNATV